MRLLLVDDSGTMRTIQKRCLTQLGVAEGDIVEAPNGQVALDLFQRGGFDAVITDWNMPVMDGLALVKAIRESDKEIPVIMVTTEAERARVVSAVAAGVSDYLVKPFTPEILKSKFQKLTPAAV